MKSEDKEVHRLQLSDNGNLVLKSDCYEPTSGLTYNVVSDNSQ